MKVGTSIQRSIYHTPVCEMIQHKLLRDAILFCDFEACFVCVVYIQSIVTIAVK